MEKFENRNNLLLFLFLAELLILPDLFLFFT